MIFHAQLLPFIFSRTGNWMNIGIGGPSGNTYIQYIGNINTNTISTLCRDTPWTLF